MNEYAKSSLMIFAEICSHPTKRHDISANNANNELPTNKVIIDKLPLDFDEVSEQNMYVCSLWQPLKSGMCDQYVIDDYQGDVGDNALTQHEMNNSVYVLVRHVPAPFYEVTLV